MYILHKKEGINMYKRALDFIVEKSHELINSPTCCKEAKYAAQSWLDSLGTANEAAETRKFIEELEADIMPIDNLIGFAGSEEGSKYFGTETAENIVIHAKQIKSNGAVYCDCPACAAAEAILSKKNIIL